MAVSYAQLPPARDYAPGIGQAVADRTINRTTETTLPAPMKVAFDLPRDDTHSLDDQVAAYAKAQGYLYDSYFVPHGDDAQVTVQMEVTGLRQKETWADVSERVAQGNAALLRDPYAGADAYNELRWHLRKANLLMSGRHLQHGDATQPTRPMEVFTNCATAATSFLNFYLLLNGAGVGRAYDDAMMLVDWRNMPITVPVVSWQHADVQSGLLDFPTLEQAKHLYAGREQIVFEVPDSREGWAKAVEQLEYLTYLGTHRHTVLILDFSKVRPKGSPIAGMQNRPASGPAPLMIAFEKVAKVRDAGMKPWRATLYIDHLFAECVLVGGARRSARMATKRWDDPDVLAFIGVKQGGMFLWSANNSVTIDEEFRRLVRGEPEFGDRVHLMDHAFRVFEAVCSHSYHDGTGEPGFINQDRLVQNDEGMEVYDDGFFAESDRYKLDRDTASDLMTHLVDAAMSLGYRMIVNPCGEIALFLLGGYCVIADVVPYHTVKDAVLAGLSLDARAADAEAEDAFRVAVRALQRVNTMNCVYSKEVRRTNRIGVGMTGFHEWALARFGYGWRDLVDEEKSRDFWMLVARMSRAVKQEAVAYAKQNGWVVPHTDTTFKPAGCRPWHALTTTNKGVLTLQELFANHRDGDTWSPVVEDVRAIQDDGISKSLTQTFANGEAEVLRVQLAYGLTVESTRNHPWFVLGRHSAGKRFTPINDWVQTEDLEPGMVLDVKVGAYDVSEHAALAPVSMFALRMRGNNQPITQPTHMNPDLAWLLGYLWGDGAMSPAKFRLRWLDRNIDNLHKANLVFREQFGVEGVISRDPNKDASSLEIASAELWHWLIKNGVYKYHAEAIDLIPQIVRRSAREDIIAFIAGLLDADGAITRGGDKSVILTQSDYRFSRHVQDVGWAVGVAFGMSHNTCGENWQQGRKSMYLLTMSAASSEEAVATLIKHSNKMAAADAEVRDWRCDRPGRARRRVIGKVESVESIGVMPTFDVEVADNHWFYAGAVKSHNTTSKLFGLTEGAHLPSMREYLRWVQFRNDDPLVAFYEERGYPVKRLKTYSGTTVVGFPTKPAIVELAEAMGLEHKVVTAAEATPAEQYEFLRLMEKYWIRGVDENGKEIASDTGNQVSYTLKYDPKVLSFDDFKAAVREGQFKVKCCSVMPQTDTTAYEYQPEQPVTKHQFELIAAAIQDEVEEDIGREHVDCASGACPIDFKTERAA